MLALMVDPSGNIVESSAYMLTAHSHSHHGTLPNSLYKLSIYLHVSIYVVCASLLHACNTSSNNILFLLYVYQDIAYCNA